MALPRQLPPGDSGSGHGPFGEKAFRGALVACGAMVLIGLVLALATSGAPRSVGVSFLALGGVGLGTSAALLLAERLLRRRPPPPPDVRAGNGRGPRRR